MNGIRPTVGIEFDDKYTNAKNGISTFISDFIHFNFGTGLYFYCFRITTN